MIEVSTRYRIVLHSKLKHVGALILDTGFMPTRRELLEIIQMKRDEDPRLILSEAHTLSFNTYRELAVSFPESAFETPKQSVNHQLTLCNVEVGSMYVEPKQLIQRFNPGLPMAGGE